MTWEMLLWSRVGRPLKPPCEIAGVRVSSSPASGIQLGHLLTFLHWMVAYVMGQSRGTTDLQTDNETQHPCPMGSVLPGARLRVGGGR